MRVVIHFLDETMGSINEANIYACVNSINLSYVDGDDVESILRHGYVGHPDDCEWLIGIPAHKIILIQEIKE